MQACYQEFIDMAGANARPCQTVVVGALGGIDCWRDAAATLGLPLLQAPNIEEADRAIAGDASAVVVAPVSLFLDSKSTETACRWLSTAAVVVVTDNETDAILWRQLAWDALTPPASPEVASATLMKAVAEANRLGRQRQLITTYSHRLASLTNEERDVLDAICEGRLNKQIAGDLKVSVRTVEQRRRRVFDKMGVESAVPLAAMTAMVQTLSEQSGKRRRALDPTTMTFRMPPAGMASATMPLAPTRSHWLQ